MDMTYWLVLLVIIVAVVLVKKAGKKPPRTPQQNAPYRPAEKTRSVANVEDQLHFVANSAFRKRKIMNRDEYSLFRKLERFISQYHRAFRIFPQVSLGEIMSSEDKNAYSSINSKRVDFVIINQYGEPCAVVEYQGSGHYQGNAVARDAVKKEACRKADIRYFEIAAEYSQEDVDQIGRYLTALSR
jgi:hypothetical protein